MRNVILKYSCLLMNESHFKVQSELRNKKHNSASSFHIFLQRKDILRINFSKLQALNLNEASVAAARLITPEDYATSLLLNSGC